VSASFTTPEGLRSVLLRLHDRDSRGYWGWRQDPEAERLMQYTIRKYRSLTHTHHCEPEDSAYAAFEAMRTRAVRCADDPWAVITRAVQVSLIAEERAAGLLCSPAQARRREIMRHHDARRFGEDETGFLEVLAQSRAPACVRPVAAPPAPKPGEVHPTTASEALNLVISMFVALGWPTNSATCALDYVSTRLMEAGDRHVAHAYLRRDEAGRAALDLDRGAWATTLRIVLGNPDRASAGTRAGLGVLAMLVCDWTVVDLLADDGLVVEIRDAAPRVARRIDV
jgi:hypothetical protein